MIAGVYATLIAVWWYAQRARTRRDQARAAAIEAVGAMAAQLRAGLSAPAVSALVIEAAPGRGSDDGRPPGLRPDPALGLRLGPLDQEVAAHVAAAQQISERLGAPLADLLDRVDADLRAAQRLRALVAAQLAGAQATGVILAVLPCAGVALGASLGVDPLHQLLRTPLGGVCAVLALAAQCAGLFWVSRLGRSVLGEAP
jgi:tight adherence protein B